VVLLMGCWASWRMADGWIVAGPHDGREKKERRDGDDGSIGSVGVSPSFDNGEDEAMDFDFWPQVWIWAVCCGGRVRGAAWAWICCGHRLVGDGGWRRMGRLLMELLEASDGLTADDGFGLLPTLEELLAGSGCSWLDGAAGLGGRGGCRWNGVVGLRRTATEMGHDLTIFGVVTLLPPFWTAPIS
ncbi:hypothetical protein ACLOJK_022752, partial [Asimina triloba]